MLMDIDLIKLRIKKKFVNIFWKNVFNIFWKNVFNTLLCSVSACSTACCVKATAKQALHCANTSELCEHL